MRYLEAVGLTLILAAAGWELFLERPLVDIRQGATQYDLEIKLDAIWGVVADLYSQSAYNRSEAILSADFAHLVKTYKWAGGENDGLSKQVGFAQCLGAGIFLLGGLFIVLSKFIRSKPNGWLADHELKD